MASPSPDDTCCRVDILEKTLNHEAMTYHFVEDPLEAALVNCHVTGCQPGETEAYARIVDASIAYTGKQSPMEVLSVEQRDSKEQEKSSPKVELKPLPPHLRYEFLDPDHQFPVIVSAKLYDPQLEKLLGVLRKHRGAIGYSIDDIYGLSPSLCMHRIFLDEGHRPFRQPQRHLNPNMQEVVKKEVVKLLDIGVIYPISNSKWVSPVQVVPKRVV